MFEIRRASFEMEKVDFIHSLQTNILYGMKALQGEEIGSKLRDARSNNLLSIHILPHQFENPRLIVDVLCNFFALSTTCFTQLNFPISFNIRSNTMGCVRSPKNCRKSLFKKFPCHHIHCCVVCDNLDDILWPNVQYCIL